MTNKDYDTQSLLSEAYRDVAYLRQKLSAVPAFAAALEMLDELSKELHSADDEPPASCSIAAELIADLRVNLTKGFSTETILLGQDNARSRAVDVAFADAIPGVFPYGCEILTFEDGSQCYIPDGKDHDLTLPFLLTKHCKFYPELIVGDCLPKVFDNESDIDDGAQSLVLKYEAYRYSDNSKRTYRSQWKQWLKFAISHDLCILPADPHDIAFWMSSRAEQGLVFSTIHFGLQALRAIHNNYDQPDPGTKKVLKTRDDIRRRLGAARSQVTGLTTEDIEAIDATAREPRLTRGGKMERPETAVVRGDHDVALVRTMHDALLRTSEALALEWRHFTAHPDGTGSLLIERSKTDQAGAGQEQFLSRETVASIVRIRGKALPTDRIFRFSVSTLKRKVKAATSAAELQGRFSGHSGRVGMAQDLTENDFKLPSIAIAGRWKTQAMPAYYARNQMARNSAVARLWRAREESAR